MNTVEKFEATEIAYQLPNRIGQLGPMKRCIVKTEAALDKKCESISDKGGVIYGTRKAEAS